MFVCLFSLGFICFQAVVFVVDSSEPERFPEALGELAKLISEKELKDASLLILANKQVLSTSNLLLCICGQRDLKVSYYIFMTFVLLGSFRE